MNNLRNSVQLIGHLGKDAETKKLANDGLVANVTIATNEARLNDKNEWENDTTWHRIVGWGKMAERMEKQMKKGKEVALQGRLVQRSYDDKNGVKRYVTEVKILGFIMLDKDARKTDKTEELAAINAF